MSEPDQAQLRPHLTQVYLHRDELVVEAGHKVTSLVFPLDCVLSAVTVMLDGESVETRTIGRETAFGLMHAVGHPVSSERVFVQAPGAAYRIGVPAFQELVNLRPALIGKIVQHAQASLIQATQDVACNAVHTARQRLAKWLLMTQDRVGGKIAPLTQEHLACMLGLQRTTVTAVARRLAADGLIATHRGKVAILDRARLIDEACECYGAIESTVEEMLGGDAFKIDRQAAQRRMMERHVREGEARVERQRQLVIRLDGAGADPGTAKELLIQFERTLAEARRQFTRLIEDEGP